MEFFYSLSEKITELLGPLGPIIILGFLGLVLIIITVSMMLSQPEDPMAKLKKQIQNPNATANTPQQQLRQGERNEQLQRFASFLEPKDVAELSKKQLELRQVPSRLRGLHAAQRARLQGNGVLQQLLGVCHEGRLGHHGLVLGPIEQRQPDGRQRPHLHAS